MGKMISVWSSVQKTGKTLFLYMLTRHLSAMLDKNIKILVCCMNGNSGNLLRLFGIGKDELSMEDIINYKHHPENKAFSLINAVARCDNLYFTGSRKTNPAFVSRNMKIYESLLEELKQSFDLVLVDTISGKDSPLSGLVLASCDHVLNLILQDKEMLDCQPFVTEKDIAYIVNMHMDIYPDIKQLSSIYGLSKVFKLPCCSELQDMKNRGKLEFYVQHDTVYNRSVKEFSCFLLNELKLPADGSVTGSNKHKGLFGGILEGLR